MSEVVLLLTARIMKSPLPPPAGEGKGEGENDDVYAARHRHYLDALRSWSQLDAPPTVFCDGSGYPLDGVRELGRFFPRGFEMLQLAAPPGRDRGELAMIEHALRHSRLVRGCRHLVKVTGRYCVHNLPRLLRALDPSTDVMADLYDDLRRADARLFAARPDFLERYLLPIAGELDEPRGAGLERLLARAVLSAAGAGLRWQPMPRLPRLVQAAAADEGRRVRVAKAVLHRLKNHLHRRHLY